MSIFFNFYNQLIQKQTIQESYIDNIYLKYLNTSHMNTSGFLLFFLIISKISVNFGFQITSFWRRDFQRSRYHHDMSVRAAGSSSLSSEEEFTMPSATTLISDIPKSQRGIGVGIDLGTTNSAVSILNVNGIPELVYINGKSTIPSVITLYNDQNHLGYTTCIGETLESYAPASTNCFTYRHVKRVIGMGTSVGKFFYKTL